AVNSVLDPTSFIEAITCNPRKKFNISLPKIAEGCQADITLFNPEGNHIFSSSDILSTSKNSIFIDKNLKGKAYGIFANNQLILNQ
ncbi:dihydroorotase, partial [Polaribacter sp.]|nr:dihydroorotase [Polaribacter sp.]